MNEETKEEIDSEEEASGLVKLIKCNKQEFFKALADSEKHIFRCQSIMWVAIFVLSIYITYILHVIK